MGKEQYIKVQKSISDMEYDLITEFIKLRKEAKMSQQAIADNCNVIRTTVARIENQVNSPQLGTMLQMLETLGYTLEIVKIKK